MGGSTLTQRAVSFASPEEWGDWLSARHATATEVWLRLAKKKTGIPSIDWEQAVEEALIWGWIDGIKKTESDTHWLQRFTPRAPKSVWSQKNRETAERLIAGGWMQPAGLAQVHAAQADGRWENAYSGGSKADLPEDFLTALAAAPQAARNTFANYDAKNRYAIYYRLTTAKKPDTRAKRIVEFIDKLTRGEKFHP